MKRTSVVVIGGGQAGLAMSACLSARDIDHVVIERGQVGERWRSERWDSLRLLTPNWQSRLPGFRYDGPDPDGYMTMAEFVDYLARYARHVSAPLETGTTVLRVAPHSTGYRVQTDQGAWEAKQVVIASGYTGRAAIPSWASELPRSIDQLAATRYRSPAQLAPGAVLVVGASASGAQLADELVGAGRKVLLAVGRHTRLPRSYRGKDILFWLDRMGVLDRRAEDMRDLRAARRQPSMQLVGHATRRIDLSALTSRGVHLLGRVLGRDGTRLGLDAELPARAAQADANLQRILDDIDTFIARSDVGAAFPAERRPHPFIPEIGPDRINLRHEGVRTVIWATGFRQSYPWLDVPALAADGSLEHSGGVTRAPGLYVLGLPFLRRRKSSFIDGVGDDAHDIAARIEHRLAHRNAA